MSAAVPTAPEGVDVYPGPRPFQTNEAPVFKGRDRERADLRDLVYAYRTVLLYSQSGAGKSSLIKAGLIPSLDARCVICRVGGELPPGIDPQTIANIFVFNALASGLEGKVDAQAIVSVRLADGLLAEAGYIVFDQFEELFTTYPERWEQREPFFQQIRELLAGCDAHLVFAIREEHLAELDRYSDLVPDSFRIRYHLDRLREPEALQAIRGPAVLYGLGEIEARAPKIVASLRRIPVQTRQGVESIAGEFIEPVHLQVVCSNLWHALSRSRQLSEAELDRLADVDRALAEYYETALHRARAESRVRESRLRQWCEDELITPSGTRGIVYMDTESGKTGSVPNAAAEALEEEKVLRREPRAGSVWFELTHDRFIGPIQASNRTWRVRRRNRRWTLGAALATILAASILTPVTLMYKRDAAIQQQRLANTQTRLDEKQKELDSVLGVAGRTPAGLVAIGLSQWQLGEAARAGEAFEKARKLNAWAALQSLNEMLPTSGLNAVAGERVRKEFLKGAGPYLATSPELKRYVCERNFYVVGASEKQPAAEEERKLWQRTFPHAALGSVGANGWTPVIVDYFITCDAARTAVVQIRANTKLDRHPFVRSWYDGCARCVVPQ